MKNISKVKTKHFFDLLGLTCIPAKAKMAPKDRYKLNRETKNDVEKKN